MAHKTNPDAPVTEMTIREEFAARAMQGILACDVEWSSKRLAKYAIECADGLIAALNEEKQ